MKKLTKQELVTLDERFIDWLGDPNGRADYDGLVGKRFLEVSNCESEYSLCEFDSLEEIKRGIGELGVEELAEWPVEAIFDLKEGKEVKFSIVTEITFDND